MAQATFIGAGQPSEAICLEGEGIIATIASAGEIRLRTAFTTPALEDLRQRCLQSTTESRSLPTQGRAVVAFANQAELHAIFKDLITNDPRIATHVCDRRKYIDIDKDLAITQGRNARALDELASLGAPDAYVGLLEMYLNSTSFRYRVAARCATVLLAAILLADQGS